MGIHVNAFLSFLCTNSEKCHDQSDIFRNRISATVNL